MYAVEFEADIRDGVVKIPEEYARLKNTHARIVVLLEGEGTDSELHALSNHAAGNVEEWKDPSEDESDAVAKKYGKLAPERLQKLHADFCRYFECCD